MTYYSIPAMMVIGSVAFLGSEVSQASGSEADGTAIVTVQTQQPGVPGGFVFTGVPQGTASAGGHVMKSGLKPGAYTSVESVVGPGQALVSISCDDKGSETASTGDVSSRMATFNIDRGETVTCVFVHQSVKRRDVPSEPGSPAQPAQTAPIEPGTPAAPAQPVLPGTPAQADIPDECEPPARVPKAGHWSVANFPGRMVCGSMIDMPLSPSNETGILEIRDCGWTVIGTGMGEDTAALTMHAVDATSGRYFGTVGGAQDGIPMTIEFSWNLKSAEWIVGDLKSEVTQQGMTCNMSRPFELKYSGP